MVEVGQLAIKIAGRESGKECLVVDIVNKNTVLIDGNVKRRNCNLNHLELSPKVAKMSKGASTNEVKNELVKFGINVIEKTSQKEEKKPTPKPTKKRKTKEIKKEPEKKEKK